jgi:ABC-2 type transport system ATP-binding protein
MSRLAHREQDTPSLGSDGIVLNYGSITKRFRAGKRIITALDHVEVQVPAGRITGLIGPDGAGKTTLMRLAAGLIEPDEGTVTVLGMDAARESLSVQAAIGYMPQRFGLYEDLSVQENLDLYADLQGVVKADRPNRYRELMHMTGLGPFTSRLAKRLSGGMKQKLGLACTLIRPPKLLLLDEPTVGVDPVSRRELWAIVYRLAQEEGMNVLLSTAYLDEAERCHEVIILHEGHVLGHGSPKSFSDRKEGCTFALSGQGMMKRELQEKLAGAPGVVDAIIQGEYVRLVMENPGLPNMSKLLPDVEQISIQPVPPRFEDTFVAMLREGRPQEQDTQIAADRHAGIARSRASDGPVIKVNELERRFGDFYAVRTVSFEVRRGEIFGLLGANGAGKSTTFRMLCGLLPPSGGSLSVAGLDLRHAAASARARIGYMSQKFSLYGNLTVQQNLMFFSSVYGLSGRKREDRIAEVTEQFELSRLSDSISGNLPLGYKQRLAMAAALMHEPDILFLDEPTSGVDPLARREFWHHINGLASEAVTVLVTTHFMEEAEYCDRVAIMAAGEILALGSPAELRSLARSAEIPNPTMEDAFISLIEAAEQSSIGGRS